MSSISGSASLKIQISQYPNILGYWDIGILGIYWDTGILGYRAIGIFGYWDTGILGYGDIGISGHCAFPSL